MPPEPTPPDGPPRVEPGQPETLRAELEREVRRVADRLRTLSGTRLAEPVPGFPSRAEAGRAASQVLADAAATLEAAAAGRAPVRRVVPVVTDLAVGDQVEVTGIDLLLASAGPPADVPAPAVTAALDLALQTLRRTRRVL